MRPWFPLAMGIAAGYVWQRRAAASFQPGNLDLVQETMGSGWLQDLETRGAAYKGPLLAAERKHGLPRYLLARLAWQESRYRDDIVKGHTVSSAGAVGIMQIVPRWHPDVNPLDVPAAIDYAAAYLARLHRQFGTWELALKAYNWGPGNVGKWLANGRRNEPKETAAYSRQILADVTLATGSALA